MFKTTDFYAFFFCIVLVVGLMLYLIWGEIAFSPNYVNENQLMTLKGILREEPIYKKSRKGFRRKFEIRFKLNEYPNLIFYSQQNTPLEFEYLIGDSIQIQIFSKEFRETSTNRHSFLFNRDANEMMLYGMKVNNSVPLFNYLDVNEHEKEYYEDRWQRLLIYFLIIIGLGVLLFFMLKNRNTLLKNWKS